MRKTTILLVSALALAFPQAGLAQSNSGLDAYTESPPNVGGNNGGDGDTGSSSGGSSDSTGTGGSVDGGSSIVSGGSGSAGFGSSGSGEFGSGNGGGSRSGGGGASALGVPTTDLSDANAAGGIAAQAGLSMLGSVFGSSEGTSAEPASSDGSGLGIILPIALVALALAVIGGLVLRARRNRTGQPETA